MENILEGLKEPLKINDVDFRVQSINTGGYATIIPYKDARVDMNRLDEVCGTNWQDKYELIDGQLFCSIGIKIEDEWIWRQDVGVQSYAEKEKGRASDAFKRAGFRWGIGRELYDYPLIQLKLNQEEFEVKDVQGRKKAFATWKLKIKDWNWTTEFKDGELIRLVGTDQNGNVRFDSKSNSNGNISKKPNSDDFDRNGFPNKGEQQYPSEPKKNTSKSSGSEKPWLNKMEGKDFTNEWLNVLKGINSGKVKSIEDVRKFYRVSKVTEASLNEVLKYQPQKA